MPRITRPQALEMTLLGIDWGAARIGLALKPAGGDLVIPRGVLEPRDEGDAVEAVRRVIAETAAQGVVVGLPLHADDTSARAVRRFARKTREGMRGVRWFFVDERLTSQAAEAMTLEPARRRPADDVAALLIMRTFLESCPTGTAEPRPGEMP